MAVTISNNFKKKFLQGKLPQNDTWKFTPVNSAFKNDFEHDDVKFEYYRTLDDLNKCAKQDYTLNAKYINYVWSKVLDDDDFSNKPMFITKGRSKRLVGQKGNWKDFKKSNYWKTFSANEENLKTYLDGRQDGFYVIRSKDELSWFADRVNDDNGNNEIIGVLGDAIEGTIDNTIGISETRPFEGILDGNGYSIKNIQVECNQSDNGIVGVLGRKGIVRNFKIISEPNKQHEFLCEKRINLKYLTSDARDVNCGILVGRNYGTIENIDASELGTFNVKNFVPEVYSVTNKADDYDDFADIRRKWSDGEENFNFLNSWCINSPGNICPYVGYFAEGIYAERALMRGSRPVLRLSFSEKDINGNNKETKWFPPADPNWSPFNYNSNASIPFKSSSMQFSSNVGGRACGVKYFGMNFTFFFDEDGFNYNDINNINTKYGNKTTDKYFLAGLDILRLNKNSAKALILKDSDKPWMVIDGDITIKDDDKLSFVSGETEWAVSGNDPSRLTNNYLYYLNDAGRFVDFPLRQNSSGQNIISRSELISYLELPGVIPLGTKHNGTSPIDGSRFLYDTPGRKYGDSIGWYVLDYNTPTYIACINLSDAEVQKNPETLKQIMEFYTKLQYIETETKKYPYIKNYYTDNTKKTLAEYSECFKNWFPIDSNGQSDGSCWTLDPVENADLIKAFDEIETNGFDNIDIEELKQLIFKKIDDLFHNVISIASLRFYREDGYSPVTHVSKNCFKFYWKNLAFPLYDFELDPEDGELFYNVTSDSVNERNGTLNMFASYFTNAYRKTYPRYLHKIWYDDTGERLANTEKYMKESLEEYLNNYVWVCDSDSEDEITSVLEYAGQNGNEGDASAIAEFFRASDYLPIFMLHSASVNKESGTTGRGIFNATFIDMDEFRYYSPRPTLTNENGTTFINQQTLGHTLTANGDGINVVKNQTIPYYRALVRSPEYYEIDACGIFTTDVNAALGFNANTSIQSRYHKDTAIVNYNNNIQLRTLSGIPGYLNGYLKTDDNFDSDGWPKYDVSETRCGKPGDYDDYNRYKFGIPNTLLNKSVRMHDSDRAAYYISPIAGANYGIIRNVELSATAKNNTNFVGFIGGVAGKQERGVVSAVSVDLTDAFEYAGVDSKKYWTVKYKTTPFFPKKICEKVNSLNNFSYTCDTAISGVVSTLFSDSWEDKVEDQRNAITDDINVYYLKPIFNVGGLFGKIVPTYVKTYIGPKSDENLYGGMIMDNISVTYKHTGNAKSITFNTPQSDKRFSYISNSDELYNGEDLHNNYGSIAGLIELETNNFGPDVVTNSSKFHCGIHIKNSSIYGKTNIPQNNSFTEEQMLPFGRFHYIPNEMNTIPAINKAPRGDGGDKCGPDTNTTWTLDYPIVTNQNYDTGVLNNIFNTNINHGGLINQSPNSCVGSNYMIRTLPNGKEYFQLLTDDVEKLKMYEQGQTLTQIMRDTLKFVLTTDNIECNVSATTRTHIGMVLDANKFRLNSSESINYTPAFEILNDKRWPGVKHFNPSFGSYIGFSRTGYGETINYLTPTKIFDASTTLTNDQCFANAKIIESVGFKERIENREMFADTEKEKDKYFWYTYDAYDGGKVQPISYNVSFTTATSGVNEDAVMGYTFKDSVAYSADGFEYKNNYVHLGTSVSVHQIRENLTNAEHFTTQGVSAVNGGFGGILVSNSNDELVMFIDNSDNVELNGNSWNYETPSAVRADGNCGVLIGVK